MAIDIRRREFLGTLGGDSSVAAHRARAAAGDGMIAPIARYGG